ncbi:VanZ family protein [Oscillatoriales cyanobacterium LEGE 11467]|uniref:VanZ family protein n=1 Tax=Zarconia navalis LEGE 11467 TaxID=1828826 RepID=A0A928VX76_9CYAN|nr:VanZ family protein [Zarconia navalis]MBE9039455.1 VanZ family protein [Zarconia navalis LEGE 11467]
MSVCKRPPKISIAQIDRLVEKALPGIAILGVAIVLIATLFPFNFSGTLHFSVEKLSDFFFRPSNSLDRIKNLLMLFPFGFGLGGWLIGKRSGKLTAAIVVLLASLGLSFIVESLQMFLPQRYPTFIDLFTNTLSGCLGFWGYDRWEAIVSYYRRAEDRHPKSYFSTLKWIAVFLAYTLFVLGTSLALQGLTQPSNWNPRFPLIIGNENNGGRPWQGSVSELAIGDRALREDAIAEIFAKTPVSKVFGDSLVASYALTGEDGYRDRSGQSPDLSPQEKSSPTGDETWLATTNAATVISQRIRQTAQFSLSAIVATDDITQTGPARTISLSRDTHHRNLTLGQREENLVVRLRSPMTGRNGSDPDLTVAGLFADTQPHHLVLSFDGSVLQVYIDGVRSPNSIDLKSGLALYHLFEVPLEATAIDLRRWGYYSLILVPFGILLGCIPLRVSRRKLYLLAVSSGIILPALLLEGLLALEAGRSMRSDNLYLSWVLISLSLLLFKGGQIGLGRALASHSRSNSESIASEI